MKQIMDSSMYQTYKPTNVGIYPISLTCYNGYTAIIPF